MKIKICGMKYSENINEVAMMQPDYLGFIFYAKSKRFVGDDFKPLNFQDNAGHVKSTAVFVNESNARIEEIIQKHNIKVIQLHGNESPQQCSFFKEKGYVLIKAIAIRDDFDFPGLKQYEGAIDFFLFDTHSSNYGGSGRSFNWSLLDQYKLQIPFFLSGGLGMHNMENLLAFKHPMLYGLDFNSRLEIKNGLKEKQSVKLVIDKIKSYESIRS